MFMSDFTTAYFLDPRAMVSRWSEAAILRRYPSQWQLWMRSAATNNESSQYRLLWEKTTVPSPSDLSPFLEDLDDRISRCDAIFDDFSPEQIVPILDTFCP